MQSLCVVRRLGFDLLSCSVLLVIYKDAEDRDRLTTAAAAIRMAWEVCCESIPPEILQDQLWICVCLQLNSVIMTFLPGHSSVYCQKHVKLLHGRLHRRSCSRPD